MSQNLSSAAVVIGALRVKFISQSLISKAGTVFWSYSFICHLLSVLCSLVKVGIQNVQSIFRFVNFLG